MIHITKPYFTFNIVCSNIYFQSHAFSAELYTVYDIFIQGSYISSGETLIPNGQPMHALLATSPAILACRQRIRLKLKGSAAT